MLCARLGLDLPSGVPRARRWLPSCDAQLAYPSELTARRYPHSRYDDDCSPRSLARAYRQRSMEVTNSSAVLVGLLRRIRVDAKAYLRVDAARRLRTLRSIEPS